MKKKTKYNDYSKQLIEEAIKAIEKGDSFRKVLAEYSIPIGTLYRRVKNPNLGKKNLLLF